MTVKQMESQFEGEWILIGEPQTTDKLEVVEGTVLHHSKDRDEVYRRAVALKPKRSAILFTGHMPANTAIVL
ncbi:MAG: hypothetical protein DLM73_14405 [Chthoniobacterales bacterium]|nr:MAG: hypothetical protein DLM73_14405 [Chthoniobacterales bacterium]